GEMVERSKTAAPSSFLHPRGGLSALRCDAQVSMVVDQSQLTGRTRISTMSLSTSRPSTESVALTVYVPTSSNCTRATRPSCSVLSLPAVDDHRTLASRP